MPSSTLRLLLKLLALNVGIFVAFWACLVPAYFMTDKSLVQAISLLLG